MTGKKIVVGVTGGIAAYKAAELVRLLVQKEYWTQVAMTPHAAHFVTPCTFEALSGNKVIWDMFAQQGPEMEHISWAQTSDLIIIAPATANFIAKMASGIADDFLSTMILAATAKILVCPAMNTQMFRNPVVQNNLQILRSRGIHVLAPGKGALACGTAGEGRLPEPEAIMEQVDILLAVKDLGGLKILVTAGPTLEPIDPVRFVTNRSTGKMGYAIAKAARNRGAQVTLISGPTVLKAPADIEICPVNTADEMKHAVFDHLEGCHMVIKAAAVSDYKPRENAPRKIKKGAETTTLEMIKNPDILSLLGKTKKTSQYLLIGFAAETEELIKNAKEKLISKNLDMIVANDVTKSDAGFGADTNSIKIIYPDGTMEDTALMTKQAVADLILDRARALWEQSTPGAS